MSFFFCCLFWFAFIVLVATILICLFSGRLFFFLGGGVCFHCSLLSLFLYLFVYSQEDFLFCFFARKILHVALHHPVSVESLISIWLFTNFKLLYVLTEQRTIQEETRDPCCAEARTLFSECNVKKPGLSATRSWIRSHNLFLYVAVLHWCGQALQHTARKLNCAQELPEPLSR